MKKSTRIVKRALAIFLIVLMSIESFGAVVSDNDGSAFITKAEFDSMKNDFQSQIDQYNTSIDNKIDGAIAGYLAGITVDQSEKKNIIYNNWATYTMLNGSFSNTFGVPQMDLNFNWLHDGRFNNGGYYYLLGALHANFNNKSSDNMRHNVVDVYKKGSNEVGAESDGLDTTKQVFVWKGVAINWNEAIHGTLRKYTSGDMAGAAGLKIGFVKSFTFTVSNGYHASDLDIYSIWNPGYYWMSNHYSWTSKTLSNSFGKIDWSSSASAYEFEHIGNFGNTATWEVSVPGWNKTFYNSSNTNITSATISSRVSQDTLGSFVKNKTGQSSDTYEAWMPRTVNATFFNTTTPTGTALADKLPSCGMLGNLSASYIFLTNDNVTYEFDKKNYTANPYNITQGYPLFYATQDTEVTWEPIFSTVSGTGLNSSEEVSVVLAYTHFENGIECGNKYITKPNDTSSTNMIWTTTGKTVRIKFKMPDDGWVVAKWWPASKSATDALSSNWYITLDNKQSSSVTFTLSK